MNMVMFICIIFNFHFFFTEIVKMVVVKTWNKLKLPAASSSYPKILLEELGSRQLSSHDTVVLLSSGEDSVCTHSIAGQS